MRTQWQPVTGAPGVAHVVIDTGAGHGEVVERLLYALFAAALEDQPSRP